MVAIHRMSEEEYVNKVTLNSKVFYQTLGLKHTLMCLFYIVSVL